MSDTSIPRTPTPGSKENEPLDSQLTYVQLANPPYVSPPGNIVTEMTPPPSTQVPRSPFKPVARLSINQNLVRPNFAPSLRTTGSNHTTWPGSVPSYEQTQEYSEAQLRDLVSELLPLVGELRMAAAHAKLQHSLLSIEIAEVAQRAAVEHEMMKRELEVLQETSPLLRDRVRSATMTPRQAPAQIDSEVTARQIRELEAENSSLQRRLKQAKRLVKQLDARNVRLEEDNDFLRQRIKQNRDHIDVMRMNGTLSLENTPLNAQGASGITSERPRSSPGNIARSRTQDPFHTLLFAGQVLSGETTSVPSTPTRPRPGGYHHGHARGTHSLSSLPLTPVRSRPMTADEILSTPVNRTIPNSHLSFSAPTSHYVPARDNLRRTDRDSTISASDQEEAYTDDDIPASQASQAASSMLRQYSGPDPDSPPLKVIPQEPIVVQSRLTGKITKPVYGAFANQKKRGLSDGYADPEPTSKKAKLLAKAEQMGLGIAVWPSPSH